MHLDYEEFQEWLGNNLHLLLWLMWQMPLMSQDEMAAIAGLPRDRITKYLKVLEKGDFLEAASLGRINGVVKRYVLAQDGVKFVMDELGIPLAWQVTQGGLRWQIRRLPMYETFYGILAEFSAHPGVKFGAVIHEPDDPGEAPVVFSPDVWVIGFQWMRHGPVDAVVQFSNGAWLPLVWLGSTQTRHSVSNKAEAALRWLGELTPSGWVVAGYDRLAATLGAEAWGHGEVLAVSADGWVERKMMPGPVSGHYPAERPSSATLDDPSDALRWAERNWAVQGLNGALQYAVFRYILDWPAATPRQLRVRFGDSVRRAYGSLVKRGLIVKADGGFYVTRKGMVAAAHEDRISIQRVWSRLGVYLDEDGDYRRRQQRHNRVLVDVETRMRHEVVDCFGGHRGLWYFPRSEDAQGRRLEAAQLSPDAMLCVDGEGPYTVIICLELELQRRPPAAVRRKVQIYDRAQRHVDEPILSVWIFENRRAEAASKAIPLDALMLTTTLDEFLTGSSWGSDSVWRMGEAVDDPGFGVPIDDHTLWVDVYVNGYMINQFVQFIETGTADTNELVAEFDRITANWPGIMDRW